MTRSRTLMVAVASTLVGVLVVGCGDSDDDDDVASATEDYCEAVADVADQAEGVRQLDAESTVDDAQTAVGDLESAISAAEDAAEDLGQTEVDALQQAYSDFQSSIDDISGSDTIAEALPQVEEAREAFLTQWDQVRSTNCASVAESTTTTAATTTSSG